jgi:hypothetical protein
VENKDAYRISVKKMTWKIHITKKKKKGDGYKNLKNVLVSWKNIIPFPRKQATTL